MAPTNNIKWAVLKELALARFPEDAEVADAMRQAEELAVQQPGDPAAFMAATEALVQADEEKRIGELLVVVNQRAHSVVGSRQAEQDAWALAAAMAAYQQKEVVEVVEDAAHQAMALLQSQSVDIATVESTTGPFLGPYRAAVDLVASADDAAMAEAYVVGMVVPQEQHVEEVGASNNIEAFFSDSNDGDDGRAGGADGLLRDGAPRGEHAPVHGRRAGGSRGHARGARQSGEGGGARGCRGGGG
jgi:hypothetical protein